MSKRIVSRNTVPLNGLYDSLGFACHYPLWNTMSWSQRFQYTWTATGPTQAIESFPSQACTCLDPENMEIQSPVPLQAGNNFLLATTSRGKPCRSWSEQAVEVEFFHCKIEPHFRLLFTKHYWLMYSVSCNPRWPIWVFTFSPLWLYENLLSSVFHLLDMSM